MITKVVIPAAGLGTRLLPATKEQPKEMLPILGKGTNGRLCLKPFLHLIFEELRACGFKDFCFIVGRGKRIIEDYFTIDDGFLELLKNKNKIDLLSELSLFYEKIRDSTIVFINQPRPLGFGNAVYCAKSVTGNDNFLVHAGDDLILSNDQPLKRLATLFEERDADAAFFVQETEDTRNYGVIAGEQIDRRVYWVHQIVEKPSVPPSRLAVIAVYIFNEKIYQALERTRPGTSNEIQLTDAIQTLIDHRCRVYALELDQSERRIEVGTPRSYREAFTIVSDTLPTYLPT